MEAPLVTIVGGGLAGSEAALQLAARDVPVRLVEMRPSVMPPAHHSADFAELVCSNSLKGTDPTTAAGLLKHELASLGCRLLELAGGVSVPAGSALAVDRAAFARAVTTAISDEPLIDVVREEACNVPTGIVIVASGPLTSPALAASLFDLVGTDRLAFFDAAAPIVDAASIDLDRTFPASRYGKGQGDDYLNCPMAEAEYTEFTEALIRAERVELREFETGELFAACMPIEELARKGPDALRYGPLKPVGLTDPRTGKQPHAVVQLRAETRARTAYNLVGFQTNLRFGEQERVFGMIPGLERATFLRHGVMHRNTFVDAPRAVNADLSLRRAPNVFLAGQLLGTEGYVEAMATGLLAAVNAAARVRGRAPVVLPATGALGSLVRYATDPETRDYQPMHVNFGLVPPLDPPVKGKRRRYAAYSERAVTDLERYLESHRDLSHAAPPGEARS